MTVSSPVCPRLATWTVYQESAESDRQQVDTGKVARRMTLWLAVPLQSRRSPQTDACTIQRLTHTNNVMPYHRC